MKTMSLKLHEELDSRLTAMARRRGEGRSAIVREALKAYLDATGKPTGQSCLELVAESGRLRQRAARPFLQCGAPARVWKMRPRFLLDTGPLVALLNRADAHHAWAKQQWGRIEPPLLTCEAVVSEACFLLRGLDPGPKAVLEAVHRGVVQIAFRLTDHVDRVEQLVHKYSRVPMSLADACLVCLAELQSESTVFTIDRDFRIYRKHGRAVIPVLMPEEPS